jgi:hypothetical protein
MHGTHPMGGDKGVRGSRDPGETSPPLSNIPIFSVVSKSNNILPPRQKSSGSALDPP